MPPKPSRLLYDEVAVPMRDGIRLATDVVALDDGTPRPAIVVRGPYTRTAARAQHDPVGLARTGWAVVVQDVRGRFDSEGEFEPFHQERADGADTIAWVAAQPWCDGRVVTMGSSYLGMSQWMAAIESPPALRAVAPLVVGGDVRDGWTYEGGALQFGFVGAWAVSMGASRAGASKRQQRAGAKLASDMERFFREPLGQNGAAELLPAYARWLDREDSAYWDPIRITDSYRRIKVPAFQVAGWYDVFAESNLATHGGLVRHAGTEYARRNQRLVVGPWIHPGVFFQFSNEFDFGPQANVIATLPQEILGWLRAAADGEEVESGVSVFVMGRQRSRRPQWVELESWPPPSTPHTLYLDAEQGANGVRGDGALRLAPRESAGKDSFLYDPLDPVPTRGGRLLGPYLPGAGPVEQRPVEEREDVLVYTSDPLPRDLTIMGQVTAAVTFATTARSADVTVKLCDVWPDGRSFNVVDSVRRDTFTPGRARSVKVEVGSTAMTFRKGHRIRVQVSSSNFPRFDRNASTGAALGEATVYEPAVQTVHHGGRRPSSVTLPLVTSL